MRQDAQLRRERLIRAAVELFACEGFGVPLEKIADRADVGRATLYRNFPDREALSAAVQEALLDNLAGQIAAWEGRDDAFFLALRAIASLVIATCGFDKIVPLDRQAPSITGRFRRGVEDLLAEPLARAKAAGYVREDFTIGEVHQAALMVAGGGLDSRGEDPEASLNRALRMLGAGLAPRDGASG